VARCAACGSELQSDALFCSVCGARVAQPTSTNATHARVAELTADEEYLKIFVGDRFEEVSLKWKAFKKGDYVGAWNWPAFIFQFVWFAYRKMYLYAGICFFVVNGIVPIYLVLFEIYHLQNSIIFDVVSCVEYFVISAFLGAYGSKIYRDHAVKTIKKTEQMYGPSDLRYALIRHGGTSMSAVFLVIIGEVVFLVMMVIGFAAYAIAVNEIEAGPL
jgi:hypothetical protein